MPPYGEYIPLTAAPTMPEAAPRPSGRSPIATIGLWAFAVASVLFLGLAGLTTWRWLDNNLLHWGIEDGKTTEVNSAELLERVRAFELASIKHSYDGHARVQDDKQLRAGPASFSLPSVVAGQRLDVNGRVTVTAGTDLAKVRPEDMQVTRQGKEVRVLITVPAPEILSAELVPGTMDIDTGQGVLSRFLNNRDLRDQAADQLATVAKKSALEQGILDDAAHETEQRLQQFLNSLPQTGSDRVTYVVVSRPPTVQ